MVVVVAVGHISSLKAIRQVKEPVPLTADLKVTYLSEILYKLTIHFESLTIKFYPSPALPFQSVNCCSPETYILPADIFTVHLTLLRVMFLLCTEKEEIDNSLTAG